MVFHLCSCTCIHPALLYERSIEWQSLLNNLLLNIGPENPGYIQYLRKFFKYSLNLLNLRDNSPVSIKSI